ncbi:MAG: biotin transporter BioY [Paracoccus sp. (in: a-proteobacteria)]|uniref:biotin transporter BioY n=1 Tax=Paracoccus sp. TaxID=267 RepID=UPI0039E70AE6
MEKDLAQVALFTAMIAALGLVPAISLGFGVPITAQTLGVMLAGALLGWKRGMQACFLFVLLVALGLPLLAGGRGGLGVFASPTVGFLLGWIPAAGLTGLFVQRSGIRSPGLAAGIGAVLGGIVVLYACGVLGMSLVLKKSLAECLALSSAFIPGDLIKAALTGLLVQALAKARPQLLARRR